MRSSGFTLMEMMIALAVAAIVMAIGVPSFQNMAANSGIRGCAIDLVTALNTSRAEAVSYRVPVLLMALGADSNGNVTDADNEWGQGGWRIDYQDTGASMPDVDFIQCANGRTRVDAEPDTSKLRFSPSGIVSDEDAGAPADVSFRICGEREEAIGRTVTINRFGKVTSERHPSPDDVCN